MWHFSIGRTLLIQLLRISSNGPIELSFQLVAYLWIQGNYGFAIYAIVVFCVAKDLHGNETQIMFLTSLPVIVIFNL